MRVAILGAGGWIGAALTKRLRTRQDLKVVACVRRRPRQALPGIEYRHLEGRDAASVMRALQGATHVVNCVMGSPDDMKATTRHVAKIAAHSNLCVIHFSSCAVFGSATGLISEEAATGHDVDWYGAAKVECENIMVAAASRGVVTTILRPSCVYGSGSYLWTTRIGRLLRARRIGDLGKAGDGTCNLVHLDDVVAATELALDRPGVHSTFILSNPDPPTWNQYLLQYARLLDATPVRRIPPWQLTVERAVLAMPLKLAEVLGATLGRPQWRIADPITPSLIRNFGQNVRYDGSKARRLLGLNYRHLDDGLQEAAAWFRSQFA